MLALLKSGFPRPKGVYNGLVVADVAIRKAIDFVLRNTRSAIMQFDGGSKGRVAGVQLP